MRTLVIIVVIALLGLSAAAFFLLKGPEAPSAPRPGAEDPFGSAGSPSVGVGEPQPGASPTMAVELYDGTKAAVPDFTKENQPEGASDELGYQAAGSPEGDYQALYFPRDSYFLVTIFAEPIGENRRKAEAELRSQLGLSDETLCALIADVYVAAEANEAYSGMNLGFSFCPGAIALP